MTLIRDEDDPDVITQDFVLANARMYEVCRMMHDRTVDAILAAGEMSQLETIEEVVEALERRVLIDPFYIMAGTRVFLGSLETFPQERDR